MIVANLLLAVGLLPLLLVDHPGETPIVYAVTVVQGSIAAFFSAAEAALLPLLVPESRRATANALNGQIRDIGRLSGAALGGVLAATGGIRLVVPLSAARRERLCWWHCQEHPSGVTMTTNGYWRVLLHHP